MTDLIRSSTLGQLIRFLTKKGYLQYTDELVGFQLPDGYDAVPLDGAEKALDNAYTPSTAPESDSNLGDIDEGLAIPEANENMDDLEVSITQHSLAIRAVSRPIVPTRTSDGMILVDWYSTDDHENPQNWSSGRKLYISFQICIYSFAVYVGSSIYSPGMGEVVEKFGIGEVTASLGLSIYVLAYGIGPMLFSPLSEIPSVGRTPIYTWTFAIFVILCIPTALVENFAGLLVLRFLTGFFGSPCLATGAATFSDMYSLNKMAYALAFWAGSVTLGPALAPIIAGFSVGVKGWHWFAWELLWLTAPIAIMMLISLPETSAANILLRRAHRLRKLTGRSDLRSQSEIDQDKMTANEVLFDALIKPWEINLLDPAVAFTTLYTALIYGIFYSFFESFPLVFPVMYHFNLGESNLPFLSVVVSLLVCVPLYCAYNYYIVEPRVLKNGFGPPEERLVPGLIATFFVPVGLFLFAWTADPKIHWIVPTIGVFFVMNGCYTLMQAIFMYLPFTYPQYAASLFAANDFARSSFAAGCILFSGLMFRNLGVAKGCTLLGGLTVGCTVCFYLLYFYGADLRKRSKFAVN